MPYIKATIFTKWVQDAQGHRGPNAVSDIYAWAIANNEQLPDGTFGKYEEVNDNISSILGNVFCAKLTVAVATAQHFANDNRIWTLGFKRFDDEDNQTSSNWNTTLTSGEITQALNYLENHGYDRQTVVSRFSASDTRLEISRKLKAFFKE